MGDCIGRKTQWYHFLKWGLLLLVSLTAAEDRSKWVWGGSGRNNGYYPDERLENRPITNYRPPPPVHETSDYNPPPYIPVPAPGYRPRPPPGPVRPPFIPGGPGGPGGPGILTGPVPSWEQGKEYQGYKHYDRCKCAYSFNCNTPGIKFGSCDVDKQYCCYNLKSGGFGEGGRPPFEGPDVLVGPGGPLGPGGPGEFVGPNGPNRPGGHGLLVGPGGPTGLIGNPNRPYGRPYGSDGDIDDDYFYPDGPYDSFGRSAGDKRKGEKKN